MGDAVVLVAEPDVELRELSAADATAVFALTDSERERIREWLPWVDQTKAVDDTLAFIARTLETEGKELAFGIWVAGELAGTIGLTIDAEARAGEIGYWLAAAFEGRGIVTRSCRALIEHGFGSLVLHRIEIQADPRNARSRAVPERLGFTLEGHHRDAAVMNGRFVDLVVYGLLEDEWRGRS